MNSWIVTPAYCKYRMLEDMLRHLDQDLKGLKGFHHVVVDNHYPEVHAFINSDRNIKSLSSQYGCIYIDSLYDRGLHRSVNHAIRTLDIQKDDIYIGCDPDDRPSPGAFQAMREVMLADPTIGVLGLMFWVIPWKMKEHGLVMEKKVIAGHTVLVHPGLEMWNVAAFNMELILGMGGFHQPNAYYGGIEVALYPEMLKRGMKLAYLVDHTSEAVRVDRENPDLYDKSYGEWKIAHATKGYVGSYEEWLSAHR